jgi:N-acetylmuramoyl-L-alanine amidase
MRGRAVWFRSRAAKLTLALIAVLGVTAAAASHGQAGSGVLKVRLGGDQSTTRVVLELDQAAAGKLLSDGSDKRIVLALPRVEVGGDLNGRGEGLVKDWAVDEAAGSARLKLTLTRDARVARRFLLPPSDGVAVYRYVIDLEAGEGASLAASRAAPIRPVRAEAPRRGKPVIVVDAGHGGKDPGAAGAQVRESAVTLAAARALKSRLEKGGRYKVVLTREADVFVPLETRVQIARRADADLFISLHADAGSEPALRGASVYTLSEKGSERVARRVMNKDGGFVDVKLPGADRSVNQILLDLTQRSTRNRSAGFAQMLLGEMEARTALLRRSHRDAGFVVLLAPDVPAVLLEMGFMTNAEDEALLSDPARRRRLMDGVGDAIDRWFEERTPQREVLASAGAAGE